ncbi:MAG: N-acetyl-gamma-glutamyl-phosphate reductase [Paracoccaceae bacterium]
METARVAVLGASGYVGAELVRLIATHPRLDIAALSAERRAGETMARVYPHLRHLDLPTLARIEEIDFGAVDLAFCALPHATSQEVIVRLPRGLKIVDTSADFRLADPVAYERWYGRPHQASELQAEAVYGLPEHHREAIRGARLVAATGCNAATVNLAVLPLLKAGVIDPDEIVVDLLSGVSGAGRAAKEAMLHAEVSEGAHPYAITGHRHSAELEQEMSAAAGRPVSPSFMPHLVPMNRGILATIHLKGDAEAVHAALEDACEHEPFMVVLPFGEAPATRHVRGSNLCHLGVVADRVPGRVVVFSAIDNLAKGSAGMAIHCANLMLGLPETEGLTLAPVFP